MIRKEAMEILIKGIGEKPIISANGYISRDLFNVKDKKHILASTEYGEKFASIVYKNNIYGFQFHPEKSQRAGQLLLSNFMEQKYQ